MAENKVVSILLLLLLGAYLLPNALNAWFSVNTSAWDTGAAGLWPVIPLLALLVLVMVQAKKAEAGSAA